MFATRSLCHFASSRPHRGCISHVEGTQYTWLPSLAPWILASVELVAWHCVRYRVSACRHHLSLFRSRSCRASQATSSECRVALLTEPELSLLTLQSQSLNSARNSSYCLADFGWLLWMRLACSVPGITTLACFDCFCRFMKIGFQKGWHHLLSTSTAVSSLGPCCCFGFLFCLWIPFLWIGSIASSLMLLMHALAFPYSCSADSFSGTGFVAVGCC